MFCLTSHMSLFTSIINTTSRPIRFCRSLTIPDLLHFLLQKENSGEQSCFPSGPTSFRATYLPVSECQTFSVYKTQAIYFVQIRVSSLFTHCLWFYFWSFIFLTYTHSLLSDGAICITVKVHTGTRILYNGLKKTTLTLLLLWLLSFFGGALCCVWCLFICPDHWIYTKTDDWSPPPVQIKANISQIYGAQMWGVSIMMIPILYCQITN